MVITYQTQYIMPQTFAICASCDEIMLGNTFQTLFINNLKYMKKWHKISLSLIGILVVLILLSLATSSGRSLVLPIVKPFSEACGYGGTSGMKVQCACDGLSFADISMGSTNYYCTGSCSQCKCYSVSFSDGAKTEVDCATFSQLDWAFPLK